MLNPKVVQIPPWFGNQFHRNQRNRISSMETTPRRMIWISSHISAGYRDRKWARDTFRRDFSDRVDPIEMAIMEEIETTMESLPEVMKEVVEVMKFWWSCGRGGG